MPKYGVYVCPIFVVKIVNIEADSPKEATDKADEIIGTQLWGALETPQGAEFAEFNEGIESYAVWTMDTEGTERDDLRWYGPDGVTPLKEAV